MTETLTIRTAASTELVKIAVPGPQGPKGDKGDPGDVAGLPLSTQGDTLYRGASQNERLPIGTTGQILRVSSSGIPEWGAAPASGVSSVNGQTGAVTITPASIDAANDNHTHNSADLFFQGLEILGAGNANVNGVYVYGGDLNGKGVYYKEKVAFIYWDGTAWMLSYNSDDVYSSAQNTTTPWQVTSWSVQAGQTSPAPSSWDRLTGDQWETVIGKRTNPTLRGDAAGKNVGTGANDVAAGNDSRFTDARQPLSHASTHHTGGTDAIAPNNIGAGWALVVSGQFITGNTLLSSGRNRRITLSVVSTANVDLPYENNVDGDLVTLVKGATGASAATIRKADALSGGVPIAYSTLATLTTVGQSFTFVSDGTATGWSLRAVDTHTHTFGTTAGTFTQGNDARLSDSRTPSSHAASHAAGIKASYNNQVSGMTSDVFIRASTAGTAGNSITLAFDGVDDIDTVLAAWNAANTSNTAEIVSGDGSQVPDDLEEITLSGGVAAGSDPFTNQNVSFGQVAAGSLRTELGGLDSFVITPQQNAILNIDNSSDAAFALQLSNGSQALLGVRNGNQAFLQNGSTGAGSDVFRIEKFGGGTANVEIRNLVLTDGTGNETATFDAQGNLTANRTYDLPDASGTLALTTTAPASHTHELTALAATGATNGHVLTANGSGGVTFAAASGGGSGGTKTYAVFTAEHNQPPSTAFATLDTRNSIAVLDFDDTTDESAVFVGIMPEGASLGSGLKIRLHWMSTNQTSNNVVWDVSLERMNTDLDADSFATIASGTAAANGTSGILTVTEITLTTIDSVTAGDAFRLKVTRDANNASDNMSNDAELVAVEVRSAA